MEADLADVVVTEHGIAQLAGQSVEERIQRVIAMADPRFREELAEAASDLHER